MNEILKDIVNREKLLITQVSFLELSSFLQKKKVTMKEQARCNDVHNYYYVDEKLVAILIYTHDTQRFTAYIIEDKNNE